MFRCISMGVVFGVLSAPASSAGGVPATGQGGVAGPSNGVITNYKTPPMQNSSTVQIPLTLHFSGNTPNWAGARVRIHILDAGELDITSVTAASPLLPHNSGVLAPGITWQLNPFGPVSNANESAPIVFTVWHPQASQSGTSLVGSVNQPLLTLNVHAKNTNPTNNSDIDLTIMFSAIYHVPNGQSAHVSNSDWVWDGAKTSPWADTNGEFRHASGSTFVTGSNYYARYLNQASIGIEHIPEPTAFWFFGIAACIIGTRLGLRRRRRRAC